MYAYYVGKSHQNHRTSFGIDIPVFDTDERIGVFKRKEYSSFVAKGRYGSVDIAFKERYGFVAIKTLFSVIDSDPSVGNKINLREQLDRELLAAIFNHPSIIKILGVGGDRPEIIMDYCPHSLAKLNPQITYDRKFTTLFQIASALEIIHAEGIVHSDLKIDNILFSDEGNAVLCDFGSCIRISDNLFYSEFVNKQSYLHCAPEVINGGQEVDTAVDIFSFGIVAYLIFLKTKVDKKIGKLKLLGEIPPLNSLVASEDSFICDLLSRCVRNDKKERPTARELKKELETYAMKE